MQNWYSSSVTCGLLGLAAEVAIKKGKAGSHPRRKGDWYKTSGFSSHKNGYFQGYRRKGDH